MQTRFPATTLATASGQEANDIVRRCVHCGFCNATCPTFALTGNELEGPRGRIYLIKSLLEGEAVSGATLTHLDHCLGCRACETTCPSGVAFHRLADIGRETLHGRAVRPRRDRWKRGLLARFFDRSLPFRSLVGLGRLFRPLLPMRLRRQMPPSGGARARGAGRVGYVMLQQGCAQPVLAPATNDAAARVLARRGFGARDASGCCGALAYHLGDVTRARNQIRRNIDAWIPGVRGSQGLVVTASGCAAFIRDYPSLCRGDSVYEDRAAELAAATRDVADFLTPVAADTPPLALHLPCTLRHAIHGADRLRALLLDSGWTLVETADDGQCCGSAGAYSLLYPETSRALGTKKVAQLSSCGPARIVTANIGCQMHLAARSPIPVQHWVEVWDELEAGAARSGD
jgi:glycolate oxidase iron-sulfur subunit